MLENLFHLLALLIGSVVSLNFPAGYNPSAICWSCGLNMLFPWFAAFVVTHAVTLVGHFLCDGCWYCFQVGKFWRNISGDFGSAPAAQFHLHHPSHTSCTEVTNWFRNADNRLFVLILIIQMWFFNLSPTRTCTCVYVLAHRWSSRRGHNYSNNNKN